MLRFTLGYPNTTCYSMFSCKNPGSDQPKPTTTVFLGITSFFFLYHTGSKMNKPQETALGHI